MPVDDECKVHFTTTLFALIRESLNIKMRPGCSIADFTIVTDNATIHYTFC